MCWNQPANVYSYVWCLETVSDCASKSCETETFFLIVGETSGMMWVKQCHFYHPWLGMATIPPVQMVTAGWFMIVLSCFTHIRRTLLAMDQDSCVFSFPREDVFVFAGIWWYLRVSKFANPADVQTMFTGCPIEIFQPVRSNYLYLLTIT